MVGVLHVSYFNYENGGVLNPEDGPNGPFHYDFNGLARVVGADDEWPDVLMMGEGYCYHLEEGRAAKEAATMLQHVSNKPYWPLLGALPGDWSVAPPVVFVNLDTNDGDKRLADVKNLRPYGDGVNNWPCIVGGDWCAVPSGPMWEPQDLNDETLYDRPSSRMIRAAWHHGPSQAGPYSAETRSLDYLIGFWQAAEGNPWGQRVGGINFYDVAEMAYDNRPTQLRKPALGRRHTQSSRL